MVFENIMVIPLYIGVIRKINSQKMWSCEQQVYIGTDYGKAYAAVSEAACEKYWPEGVTDVKMFIKHYHIKPDGAMAYIIETEV